MRHFFRDIPRIGNVAISRHAQDRAVEDRVNESAIEKTLMLGTDTDDGLDIVWREHGGVRLVIVRRPTPFRGAALVKTIYRVQPQARAKRTR